MGRFAVNEESRMISIFSAACALRASIAFRKFSLWAATKARPLALCLALLICLGAVRAFAQEEEQSDKTKNGAAQNSKAMAAAAGEVPAAETGEGMTPEAAALAALLRGQRALALGEAGGDFDPAWTGLIHRLAADGHNLEELVCLFSALGPNAYTPAYMATKITELYGVPGLGINREAAPDIAPPSGYRPPVPDATAGSCLAFLQEHKQLFEDIKKRHGVDENTLLALVLVETNFGLDLGRDSGLRVLASMAATDTPARLASMGNSAQAARIAPARLAASLRDKSAWAYKELRALLRHGRENANDTAALPASFFGAMGICQFMPSNIEPYALDGDGDGIINLFTAADALYSVANYLEAHGWRNAKTDAQKQRVLMTYNHDALYAAYVASTAKQVAKAQEGKVPAGRILLAGGIRVPSARLDPSLRRLRPVPTKARVKSLGDYKSLLQ